jgi:hypothetical protein
VVTASLDVSRLKAFALLFYTVKLTKNMRKQRKQSRRREGRQSMIIYIPAFPAWKSH